MKRFLSIILISFMIIGCASKQNYMIPSGKNKNDFLVDREECANLTGFRGDGTFLFGPLIIIFPIFITLEVIRGQQQKKFQICMVDRGYQCNEGCWDINGSHPNAKAVAAQPPKSDKALPLKQTVTDTKKNLPPETLNPTIAAKETARAGYFIEYDNGVVLDTRTNLMWAARDNGSGISWEKAKLYCYEYKGGGYTDWRMPTHDELASLHNEQINGMNGYNVTRLIELTSCCPWASNGDGAYFRFDGGTKEWNSKPFFYRAYRTLPVRQNK
jgi:hypothetical protein